VAGNELYVIAAVAIGGGLLLARFWMQSSRREQLANDRGLDYVQRGLAHLPSEFLRTVLFSVGDGGHESHVAAGTVTIGDQSIPHSVFELQLQRDVRGEWAYLATSPAFRIHSPTTVLAYTLDRDFRHTVIKRRGPSLIVAENDVEAFTSLAGLLRDISGIERAMQVEPPNGIDQTAIPFESLGEEYFVWSAHAESARTALGENVQELLMSAKAGGRDLTIELLGPLVIIYCASDGRLSADDVMSASAFADELCERLLASSTPADD